MDKLKVVFDSDRAMEVVTVDEYINLESKKIQAIKDVIGKFLIDPETDEYYKDSADGAAVIGKLPIGRLLELNTQFLESSNEAVAPKAPEEDSEEQ